MSENKKQPNNGKSEPKKRPARKKAQPKKRPASKKVSCPVEVDASSVYATLSSFFAIVEDPSTARHNKNMRLLCSQVQEYMSNFILIGYTVDGTPLNVTYANNPKDYDALSTALQRYIFDTHQKPPFPPGNDTY